MLEDCLRSILGCSLPAAEVIVVDQSEDEATRLVVCRYQGGKVPVRYLRGKETGLSRAKNQGIADCTSEIIALTDDDCRVDPGWIQALAEPLQKGAALAAVGRTLPGRPEREGEETFSIYSPRAALLFGRKTHPWRVGGGGNFAVLREVIRGAGPFDERFGPGAPLRSAEDMDMVHRLLRAGTRIVYVPEAVVWHRSWRNRSKGRHLSRSYGIGAGAYFTKYFISGDPLSGWRFLQRLAIRSLHLLQAMLRGDRRRVADQAEYLVGLFEGAGRFLTLGKKPKVVVPELKRERA
jgi:GT2 family glycosyltransferase